MWDRRLPGADAALSIRPARSQPATQGWDACVEGELEVEKKEKKERKKKKKMVNGYRAKIKRSPLEVGVKVHLPWLEGSEKLG